MYDFGCSSSCSRCAHTSAWPTASPPPHRVANKRNSSNSSGSNGHAVRQTHRQHRLLVVGLACERHWAGRRGSGGMEQQRGRGQQHRGAFFVHGAGGGAGGEPRAASQALVKPLSSPRWNRCVVAVPAVASCIVLYSRTRLEASIEAAFAHLFINRLEWTTNIFFYIYF